MVQDVYSTFISKSRYARYLPEKNRREHWPETVDRYLNFMSTHLKTKHNYTITDELTARLRNAIVNMEVMPSMRAMMTAGKAAERDNTCTYNCSYLPVEDPKAFDEGMMICLSGTGVGFSVERQYTNKLPEIPDILYDSDTNIIVKDSKEGWAKALRQLIALLYSGEIPKYDLSRLRPAGSKLKTFGGRSSGPAPLDDLFKFVIRIFKNAAGRKLTSLECHDIMCMIGAVAVVGGVRRSAFISLSNLSDDRMRNAKSGAWWEAHQERALANNSAVYTEKPEIGVFMKEWMSLYESKSGERGMFNREAALKQIKKNGRRDANFVPGVNPCCLTGDTTLDTLEYGKKSLKDVIDIIHNNEIVHVNGYVNGKPKYTKIIDGTFTKANAEIIKLVVKVSTGEIHEINLTPDHRVFTFNRDYVEASKLEEYDLLNCYIGNGRFNHGQVLSKIDNGKEDVYDIQTDSENFYANDVLVHNCEILLRPYGVCNLTEVVARSIDTEETLKEKIEIATILGTFQSTLTHFPYLRKIWQKNADEERLLGVSITGIYDSKLLNDYTDKKLPDRLTTLKNHAIEINKKLAEDIGIPQSAAITCTKPSGNISQLVDSASGIHPRYDEYYIRRVRNDNKDMLTNALKSVGVYSEPDVTKPEHITVFSFAKKAPKGALTRNDITAIDHLNLWLIYQTYWCEHKPSVTISVKEDEWMEVGAWVYKNFDDLSGLSFLPYDGGTYRQAPYETCTKEQYEELLAKTPKTIDWDSVIEAEDNTEGSQTLACSAAGGCEL